jgi:mRNA interferase RelE/StbE
MGPPSSDYRVEMAPAAARQLRKLDDRASRRVRVGLRELAADVADPAGGRGGKARKTLRGTADTFHRLRIGDYRVMYDVIAADRVVLVLGIVHRRDLERWLRGR